MVEEIGGVAGPCTCWFDESVDGFAKRVGAGPDGVGERVRNGLLFQAEGWGGGRSPSGAVGESADVADLDVADAAEGGGDGIAERGGVRLAVRFEFLPE